MTWVQLLKGGKVLDLFTISFLDATSLRKCKFGWLIYDCVSVSERYLDRPTLEGRSHPPPSVRLLTPRFWLSDLRYNMFSPLWQCLSMQAVLLVCDSDCLSVSVTCSLCFVSVSATCSLCQLSVSYCLCLLSMSWSRCLLSVSVTCSLCLLSVTCRWCLLSVSSRHCLCLVDTVCV